METTSQQRDQLADRNEGRLAMADHADESSQWIRSLVAGDDRVVAEFWQACSPALRHLLAKIRDRWEREIQ
jgi:hypothetical protein